MSAEHGGAVSTYPPPSCCNSTCKDCARIKRISARHRRIIGPSPFLSLHSSQLPLSTPCSGHMVCLVALGHTHARPQCISCCAALFPL
jgi:hypothetical protein